MSVKSQGGFSAAEIVIVMALSSIAAVSVVPVASTILNHHRLSTATRELAFEIARARMQAIGQNAHVRLVAIGSNSYMRERSTDGGTTWVADGALRELPSGIAIATGDTGMPRFDRQGIGTASSVIMVSGPAGVKTLTTNILGRVQTS